MLWLKPTTEYVGTNAHNGAGIEHGANTRFGEVAHHQTTENTSCILKLAGCVRVELHIAVIIFEVRVVRICPQITPLANDRIPEKTVMPFVTIAKENGVAHFTPNFAKWPNAGITAHFTSPVHRRFLTQ